MELRIVETLCYVRVHHSRHALKLGQHAVGYLAIPLNVRSIDLNIHRRGHPEIENLANHIGRQEIKHHAGIVMSQFHSQVAHIIGRGMVLGFERDHDVRIIGADESGCPVDIADIAVGQADVVDDAVHFVGRHHLTDGGFHHVAQPRHLFDTRSRLGSHVQNKLAAIRVREKILPEPGHQ